MQALEILISLLLETDAVNTFRKQIPASYEFHHGWRQGLSDTVFLICNTFPGYKIYNK